MANFAWTRVAGDSPAWPTQLMIRLPLSLQLYNLPDEALEDQVLDRPSV